MASHHLRPALVYILIIHTKTNIIIAQYNSIAPPEIAANKPATSSDDDP